LTATVCGLPGASSVMLMEADLLPVALGVKVTEIVQLAFAASVLGAIGQVGFGANAKSPAFVPPSVIELIVSGAVPVFFSVTDCSGLVVLTVWLPKVRLAGVSVTAGCVPLPLSATVWGLPLASSTIEMLAVRLPVAVGANVTWIVQLAFTARE